MRRHDAQYHLSALNCIFQINGGLNVVRKLKTGEENLVLTSRSGALRQFLLVKPEADSFELRSQDDRQCGTPTAAPDDGQPLQGLAFLMKVNTFSLPPRMRSMFAPWR